MRGASVWQGYHFFFTHKVVPVQSHIQHLLAIATAPGPAEVICWSPINSRENRSLHMEEKLVITQLKVVSRHCLGRKPDVKLHAVAWINLMTYWH